MATMSRARRARKGRRATSALRPHDNDRRTPERELPGRGRVRITGPGAAEFLRALDMRGDA